MEPNQPIHRNILGGHAMQIIYTDEEKKTLIDHLETRIRKMELDIEVIKHFRRKPYENVSKATNTPSAKTALPPNA